jgi:predicted Zn-dependent peptidase
MRGSRPITADELRLAVAALTRGYARNFETADQIGRAATQLALYELPDTYFSEFVPRVEAVTVEGIADALARNLDPARLTTVVVGDYDVVGADLARIGLGDPVVMSAETF